MRSSLLVAVAVWLHYAFVAFVVVGGFLALRYPRLIWPHLVAAGWGLGIITVGQACPLTALEDWARGTDSGPGFVDRHLTGVLYSEQLERPAQAVFLLVVVASWVLLLRQRSSRTAKQPAPAL